MAYRPERETTRCPDCGNAPVNVQGLADCPHCDWRQGTDRR